MNWPTGRWPMDTWYAAMKLVIKRPSMKTVF